MRLLSKPVSEMNSEHTSHFYQRSVQDAFKHPRWKRFCEIVNGLWRLTSFAKKLHHRSFTGSKITSVCNMIVTDNVTEIALMMKSIFAEVFPKRMFNLDFKI